MKKTIWKIVAIVVIALGLGYYDMPTETQSKIPFLPQSETTVKLGLDLQGGSQLDYKIDLRKVPEKERKNIVEGVKEVITKRVDGLGVAEPNIYTSEVAGETHITVELANNGQISQDDVDKYLHGKKKITELTDDEKKKIALEKAKETVGKTIQLEFKEQKDTVDTNVSEEVKTKAQNALDRIVKNKENFNIVGREEEQAYPGKVTYKEEDYTFESNLPATYKEAITKLKTGDTNNELVKLSGSYIQDDSGKLIEETGVSIIKLIDKKEEVKDEKEIYVSHILIEYKGAERANSNVTRSKEEAEKLAKEIEEKLKNKEDFAELAKEYSDDISNKDTGGVLKDPVTKDAGYVKEFIDGTLKLTKKDEISAPVETSFGYHIIKANEVKTDVKETKYKYAIIKYSTTPDPWKDTRLNGEHFVHANVEMDQFYQPYVSIQFDDEGAKLFEEITKRNVGKPLAIFVGGELISAPNVNEAIAGGKAQISGSFDQKEANDLARNLNTGAIPAPIILTGEYTIGASLGHSSLTQSVKAGLIGLLLVLIFMMFYYRLSGVIADIALVIYASILVFLIKSELSTGLALLTSLVIFIYITLKIINNKDSGWEKFISFILSLFGFFFLTFLLKTGVVLTLAGIAGLILSIGMAVDANILIFERFKEEIRNGHSFKSALDRGFDRAWSAIRDSNFSTLITCAILFYFGGSIIKGFAFNLAAGILVSMFTAITVTKTLMSGFIGTKLSEKVELFGASKKEKKRKGINFMKASNIWLGISGAIVAMSLISIFTFGLNLGIDFKGGTLMELNFTEDISKTDLINILAKTEDTYNKNALPDIKEDSTESSSIMVQTQDSTTISQDKNSDESIKIDLKTAKVLQSNESTFIIKSKYLTSDQHDKVIKMLEEELPEFTETRFSTIGPIIGSTLFQKAIWAMVIALIMIILYIGFAFRKIPKSISPWRFGASAIVALAHDMIVVTGIFAVLGKVLNVEIDALFITAMLTVFGYSVNDTIVIFDRIRENLIKHSGHETFREITNNSLNETIARSINTSLSTIIVLVAVLILGSPSIFYFILALTLGTIVGTYSSLLVASPVLVKWTEKENK